MPPAKKKKLMGEKAQLPREKQLLFLINFDFYRENLFKKKKRPWEFKSASFSLVAATVKHEKKKKLYGFRLHGNLNSNFFQRKFNNSVKKKKLFPVIKLLRKFLSFDFIKFNNAGKNFYAPKNKNKKVTPSAFLKTSVRNFLCNLFSKTHVPRILTNGRGEREAFALSLFPPPNPIPVKR